MMKNAMKASRFFILLFSNSPLHRKRCRLLIIFVAFIVFLHYILKLEEDDEKRFANLDIEIPKGFEPVQIIKRELLPSSGVHKMPKIIHQTWKDTNIPKTFVKWVKSWLHHHPDWQYWLWTDESAGKLIADKYPQLLDTYYGYSQPIRRADALRYVVLHEYGGIYADMDMEALTSLDPLSIKYSCFIGQEPFEHPVMDTNFDPLVINALIGCTKGHPFMKMLMDNLPSFAHMWNYLDSTGPHFVTYVYKKFLETYPFSTENQESVYLTPSEYFYPTMDPAKVLYILEKCKEVNKLSRLQYKACMNLKYKHLPENKVDSLSIAFTNHHWYHTYLRLPITLPFSFGATSIYEICPSVYIYKSA